VTQTRRPRVPSPGTVEQEKQRTVFGMLPEDGSKRRWTDLEKEARNMKMSIRTLKKNLDKLESAGLVARHVDTSKRPPGVYYSSSVPKRRIRYVVGGPEGGHNYEPNLVWENTLESLNKEISELKKKSIEGAKQKLGELVMFNINDITRLFLRELRKEQGDIETFDRWINVVVLPRLEMLLQLCIRHFDVAEQVKEKMDLQLRKHQIEEY
jgi:DNA-binding transcriptional ArsR family regulator